MIKLQVFGPMLGTPDASPFVTKAMMLLKLAGLEYQVVPSVPFRSPRGMLPCVEDDGVLVPDSSQIRTHIERKYGFNFDAGLSAERKAQTWMLERMCEDHLYFAVLRLRWLDRANFEQGVARLFSAIPAPVRPLVKKLVLRSTAKRLHGHGLGRLSEQEITQQADRDLEAMAGLLGAQPWLGGERPCGADATLFAFVTALITPPLASPIVEAWRRHANLVAYRDRLSARYFPELQAG